MTKPPALKGTNSSEVVAKNLNALHAARKAFIENEASEKLRRALRHKLRPITTTGDKVFYKCVNLKEWKEPAAVTGKDDLHGGIFVRIHPCSLRLVNVHVSLDKKTKEVGAGDCVDQNLDGSVQKDVADSDSGLRKNMSDEGLISPGNSQNNGIFQQVQNDQSFHDTVVDYEQEDSMENPLENPYSYGQEREEKNPIMLGKKVPSVKSNIEYKVKRNDPWKEAIVISRAGKATGKNKYWMNIKDLEDGTFKSINFEEIEQWRLKDEVILLADNNHSTIEAKHLELQNWRYHKVYTEVEYEGQP